MNRFPTPVLTDRFKESGFNLLNSKESPRNNAIQFYPILSTATLDVNGGFVTFRLLFFRQN